MWMPRISCPRDVTESRIAATSSDHVFFEVKWFSLRVLRILCGEFSNQYVTEIDRHRFSG
jgi:hypothetical protein